MTSWFPISHFYSKQKCEYVSHFSFEIYTSLNFILLDIFGAVLCYIRTTSTQIGSLRNYTNGVIQVTLLEYKMRLNNNME